MPAAHSDIGVPQKAAGCSSRPNGGPEAATTAKAQAVVGAGEAEHVCDRDELVLPLALPPPLGCRSRELNGRTLSSAGTRP